MKRLRRCLLLLTMLVFTVFGTQAILATETGTTGDGFRWMYEEGTMAITGYVGEATTINIPSSINDVPVTLIQGDAVFTDDNTAVRHVSIPNSVTTIGVYAFSGWTGLKSISIPNSVKEICGAAFEGCSSLTDITIPNSVTRIESSVFCDCTGLTSITIPNSITMIDYLAFEGCTSLTGITIPNSVTMIGDSAFYGCTGIKSITIPKSITSISFNAFGYYRNALDLEKKLEGFTVYGYYGTAAESYAKYNKFRFIGTQNDITDRVEVLHIGGQDYTGEEIKPTVKVSYLYKVNGKYLDYIYNLDELKEGTDYTVSYSNNIEPGTATATVTFINHYRGTLTKAFTIFENEIYRQRKNNSPETIQVPVTINKSPTSVKAKAKKNKVTVSWKKIKKSKKTKALLAQIKGIEVQYSNDPSFPVATSVKVPLGKKKTKLVLKGLPSKTTYYVRVRYTDGAGGYSNWSKVKAFRTK